MKRTTRSRFDPNAREEDNNLREDQLLENGATSSSLEPPNSPAKPPSVQSPTPKIRSNLDNNVYEVPIKAIPESVEWIFLVVVLGLEMLSAAFDQASSPSKPHYALLSMLCAVAALLTTIWELTYKAIKERVVLRRSGLLMLPYLYYPPPRNTVFGDFYDIYGLVGGISQCACSAVQYVYFLRHADNPIKSSLLPAIFLMCLGGSRLNRNRRLSSNVDSKNLLTRELNSNRPLLDGSCTSAWGLSVQAEREPSNLQLVFAKSLSLPIHTGSKISDEDNNPIKIMVVENSGANQMVPINLPNPIKVEIVVLDGDFPTGDHAIWTSEGFDNNILRERAGRRPLLTGDVNVTVRDGFATVGGIAFTDNSSWIRSRKFRLGARVAPGTGYQGARIREAMTDAFVVKDHRGEVYKKHHPPRLEDEVWRLEKIGKDGAFHKKLASENIHTVQDFLKLFVVDRSKLRRILGVGISEKIWEVIVKHARTCVMGNKMFIFRGSHFLIFLNPICQVLSAVVNGQNLPTRDLSNINSTYIENLVREAYVNWNSLEVVDAMLDETALLTQGDHVVEQYPNHHTHPHAMARAVDQQNGHLGAADHHHHKSINVGYQPSSIDFECTATSENTRQIDTPPYLFSPLPESIKCSISDSSSDGDLTSQGL